MITKLKLLIDSKGLKQVYVAREANMLYETLSKYCTGTLPIAPHHIKPLAKVLGVKESDLCQQ